MKSISNLILSFSTAIALLIEGFSIQNNVQAAQHQKSSILQNQVIFVAQSTAQDWLEHAVDRANQGNFRGAISDLDHAIELEPQNAKLYANRAGLYSILNEYDRAEADATHAIALDPNQSLAYLNRGTARQSLKKYQQAIEDYTQALKIGVPQWSKALIYFSRGGTRRLAGDLTGAIADTTQAIELDPQFAEAYDSRGLAYADQRESSHARDDFQKAAELYRKRGDQENYRAVLARLEALRTGTHSTK